MMFGKARIATMTPDLAAELTQIIFNRVHGEDFNNDGDFWDAGEIEPDPFETWQEFNSFLTTVTDDPLPHLQNHRRPDRNWQLLSAPQCHIS
ncbi:hypothetical protein ACFL54_05430 [Planctomycetota bacterium]